MRSFLDPIDYVPNRSALDTNDQRFGAAPAWWISDPGNSGLYCYPFAGTSALAPQHGAGFDRSVYLGAPQAAGTQHSSGYTTSAIFPINWITIDTTQLFQINSIPDFSYYALSTASGHHSRGSLTATTTLVIPASGDLQIASNPSDISGPKEQVVASFREYVEKANHARRAATQVWRKLDELITDDPPEDGYESSFSRAFTSALEQRGAELLSAYRALKSAGKLSTAVQCETLKVIGRLRHPATHRLRLTMLLEGLRDSMPAVRDSAAIGLSYLEDASALPALRAAASVEPRAELKQFMLTTADELASTARDAIAFTQGAA